MKYLNGFQFSVTVKTLVRRIGYSKEDRKSSFPGVVSVLGAVDAQATHLIGLHDRIRGAEPFVVGKMKKRAASRSWNSLSFWNV